MGTGMAILGYAEKPSVMAEKAGRRRGRIDRLMYVYREMFARRTCACSILLSADDFRRPRRYKFTRNTMRAMLSKKIVPIINENDRSPFREIKVGDNDKLSSDVSRCSSTRIS